MFSINGCLHPSFISVTMVTEVCQHAWKNPQNEYREVYMHAERDPFSSGYPDPSFALDQMTDCEDSSRPTSDYPDLSLAPDRVVECQEDFSHSDYPDPSLGLLPAEEEEMEEAYA
jgi:hypothetical protein